MPIEKVVHPTTLPFKLGNQYNQLWSYCYIFLPLASIQNNTIEKKNLAHSNKNAYSNSHLTISSMFLGIPPISCMRLFNKTSAYRSTFPHSNYGIRLWSNIISWLQMLVKENSNQHLKNLCKLNKTKNLQQGSKRWPILKNDPSSSVVFKGSIESATSKHHNSFHNTSEQVWEANGFNNTFIILIHINGNKGRSFFYLIQQLLIFH